MNHLPAMLVDLSVILVAAALSTLLFSRLRQPIVLGYLIAGFLVGPHFPLMPTVVDGEGVQLWAEIGVIFLLFGLGLEFSFKKLAKVGKSAFVAALFEIITMGGIGYAFGRIVGWTHMDSVYLGAILSMSSTTIIVRAFGEAGFRGKAFVALVFGILIVEDLMAILIMVVLSAISVPGSFSAGNISFLSARLGFFLLIWFITGIYILPSALRRVRNFINNEILLIASIALCFLMVVLASKAGFSPALGAFIMGSILAETEEGERIEHLLISVKDLFAAVFFVSVGMMIDPVVLKENFVIVILITIITVIGKLLGSGFGALLSGRSLKHSVQAGMSLAQIGEFSFIIATLGMSLNAIGEFLYPIVIAVSAVTTFTTPYMIRNTGPIYGWIEARLPRKLLERLKQYEVAMASNGSKEGAFQLLWRTYGIAALLNSVVVIAIGLGSSEFVLPWIIEMFGDHGYVRLLACLGTLVACAPFLFAIALKVPKKLSHEETATLVRLRRLQLGVLIFRVVLALALIEVVIDQFARTRFLPLLVLIATPVALFFGRRFIEPFYTAVEIRFLTNLNAKEAAKVEALARLPQLAPWSATLTDIILSSDSKVAGKSLEEAKFRTVTGATVVMIDRGKTRIFAPSRAERLLPNDQIFLVGTEEQIGEAQRFLEPSPSVAPLAHDDTYNLESIVIESDSRFAHKSIREIGLGDEFSALIVGIERGEARILNPESNTVLQVGDVIWVFGRGDRIRHLKLEKP